MPKSQFNWAAFAATRPEFAQAERVWHDVLGPELTRRERDRARIVNRAILKTGLVLAAVMLAVLGVWLLAGWGIGSALQPGIFLAMVVAAPLTAFDWIKVFTMKTRTKELVLGAATTPFGFRYDTLHPDLSGLTDLESLKTMAESARVLKAEHPFAAQFGFATDQVAPAPTPAYDILKAARLLADHDNRKFEDLIEGTRAGTSFSLVEAKLSDTSGDNNSVRFRGVLFHVEYPERFLGRTLIARRNWSKGWFSDHDLNKVDLVSSELARAFRVYSTDQVEARALLTPDRMERLIALERHFKGGNLRAIFEDGHLTLALDAKDKFEGGSIFKTLVDPARFVDALREIGLMCDVIDGFLTRDWAKERLGH